MGYIELLVNLLHREHSYVHEHLLSALLSFVTDHEPSLTECLRSELKLKRILTNKIEEFKDKEEFLVRYFVSLIMMMYSSYEYANGLKNCYSCFRKKLSTARNYWICAFQRWMMIMIIQRWIMIQLRDENKSLNVPNFISNACILL